MKFSINKKLYSAVFLLSLAVSLALTGCSEAPSGNSESAVLEVTVLNKEIRSALPVINESNVSYVVTATKGSETKSIDEVNRDTGAYQLSLGEGTWNVNVTGYEGGKAILSGNGTVAVSKTGRYYLTVPVFYIANGEGEVNLELNVAGTEIKKLLISGTGQFDGEYEEAGGKISVSKAVKSGNYVCTLMFYDASDVLMLALRETVNVRQNMSTSTWFKNGSEQYLIPLENDKTGKSTFVLTNEIIKQISNTTFFVSGGSEKGGVLTLADQKTGSWLSPYAKMQDAINKVVELNKINPEEYLIYVDGEITGENAAFSVGSAVAGEALKLTVAGFADKNSLTGDAVNNVITFNGSSKENSLLAIKDVSVSGLTLYFEQSKLSVEGKTDVENGHIYIRDGYAITLKDELWEKSVINILLENGAVGTKAVDFSGFDLEFEICNKIKVLNKVLIDGIDYQAFCVDTEGLLSFMGLNTDKTDVVFDVPKYSLTLYGLFRKGVTITMEVKRLTGPEAESVCYMAILQNGDLISSTKTNGCSITIPEWLSPGEYSILGVAVVDGAEYSVSEAFNIE